MAQYHLGPIVLLALGIPRGAARGRAQPRGTVARVGVLCSGAEARFLPRFERAYACSTLSRAATLSLRSERWTASMTVSRPRCRTDRPQRGRVVTAGMSRRRWPRNAPPRRFRSSRRTSADRVGIGLEHVGAARGTSRPLSHYAADLSAKQVELFKQTIPTSARSGAHNPTNPLIPGTGRRHRSRRRPCLLLVRLEVRDTDELARAFDAAGLERGDGCLCSLTHSSTPKQADCPAGDHAPAAHDGAVPRVCGSGRAPGLWPQSAGDRQACRYLCRQDPQRDEGGRPSSRTTHAVRAGDEPQGRQGSQPHDPRRCCSRRPR